MILERQVKMSSELEFIAVTLYMIFRVREVKSCWPLTFAVPISV